MNNQNTKFPKNFLWGSATAAHQVEGDNHNDWTEWEQANSARLAAEAAKRNANSATRIPNYILENYPNPLQEENYISGRACDHYNRFREDFALAKSLGHNGHRFSIEWSRIEPEQGKFNEKEIEHYRQVILALKELRVEPFVTLWHWTNPLWFRDKGGWLNKDAPKYFERYVNKITRSFNFVKFWITLNEPEIYTSVSYFKGEWPPQKKNPFSYLKVMRNLIRAHREIYKIIKKNNPNAKVGIAKNNVYFETYQNKFTNLLLKKLADWWWNSYFLNQIDDYSDFVGLNYYFHKQLKFSSFKYLFKSSNFLLNQTEMKLVSDMGWEIYPEGICHVLKDLKKYNKPIYITENGLADARDEKRANFIKDHLFWIHKAMGEGADVRGYFYWSLLDNFEWDKGFWPRFGLVEIDYKTMERKIRPSAFEYKSIILNK